MRAKNLVVVGGLVLGTILAVGLTLREGGASANDIGDETGSEPAPPSPNPFELTDPGPGAIPFDELSPDEQVDVEAMAAETETNCGANVQTALAKASAQEAARARNEIAARSVGLEGADQDGVVP